MKIRTFISLDFDEQTNKAIFDVFSALKDKLSSVSGVRFSFVKDFHLTLVFLGDIDEKDVAKIEKELQKFSPEIREFLRREKLSVKGVDFFTRMDRVAKTKLPAVLFMKTVNELLDDLQAKIYSAIIKLDLAEPEKKRFTQHLTFARIKYDSALLKDKNKLVEKLDEIDLILKKVKFDFASLRPAKIVLYKSELSSNGPDYTELFSIK